MASLTLPGAGLPRPFGGSAPAQSRGPVGPPPLTPEQLRQFLALLAQNSGAAAGTAAGAPLAQGMTSAPMVPPGQTGPSYVAPATPPVQPSPVYGALGGNPGLAQSPPPSGGFGPGLGQLLGVASDPLQWPEPKPTYNPATVRAELQRAADMERQAQAARAQSIATPPPGVTTPAYRTPDALALLFGALVSGGGNGFTEFLNGFMGGKEKKAQQDTQAAQQAYAARQQGAAAQYEAATGEAGRVRDLANFDANAAQATDAQKLARYDRGQSLAITAQNRTIARQDAIEKRRFQIEAQDQKDARVLNRQFWKTFNDLDPKWRPNFLDNPKNGGPVIDLSTPEGVAERQRYLQLTDKDIQRRAGIAATLAATDAREQTTDQNAQLFPGKQNAQRINNDKAQTMLGQMADKGRITHDQADLIHKRLGDYDDDRKARLAAQAATAANRVNGSSKGTQKAITSGEVSKWLQTERHETAAQMKDLAGKYGDSVQPGTPEAERYERLKNRMTDLDARIIELNDTAYTDFKKGKTGGGSVLQKANPGVSLSFTPGALSRYQSLDSTLSALGVKVGRVTSGTRTAAQQARLSGGQPTDSAHLRGEAVDLVFPGEKDYAALAERLRAAGFRAQFERKGQVNANGSTASGDHIHVTLAEEKPATGGGAQKLPPARVPSSAPGAPPAKGKGRSVRTASGVVVSY